MRWQLVGMARLAAMLLCSLWACTDNPYWIGHLREPDQGCAPDALVCSGFERALAEEWPTTRLENAGELEHTSERVHSGAGALRAETREPRSVAVVIARFAPLHAGRLYLRAHLFVADRQPTEIINLFFLGARPDPQGTEPFIGMDLNLEQGALQLYSPQAEPRQQTGELTIPRDRWFCLRAEFEIAERAQVQVFVDDVLALRATQVGSAPAEGVGMLRAGVDWSSQQSANFELFMDDLALDTRPVPCLTE